MDLVTLGVSADPAYCLYMEDYARAQRIADLRTVTLADDVAQRLLEQGKTYVEAKSTTRAEEAKNKLDRTLADVLAKFESVTEPQ